MTLIEFLQHLGTQPEWHGNGPVTAGSRARNGDTPLHAAIWAEDNEAARALIDAGADVNASGEDSYTPLHAAIAQRNATLARRLTDRGGPGTRSTRSTARCARRPGAPTIPPFTRCSRTSRRSTRSPDASATSSSSPVITAISGSICSASARGPSSSGRARWTSPPAGALRRRGRLRTARRRCVRGAADGVGAGRDVLLHGAVHRAGRRGGQPVSREVSPARDRQAARRRQARRHRQRRDWRRVGGARDIRRSDRMRCADRRDRHARRDGHVGWRDCRASSGGARKSRVVSRHHLDARSMPALLVGSAARGDAVRDAVVLRGRSAVPHGPHEDRGRLDCGAGDRRRAAGGARLSQPRSRFGALRAGCRPTCRGGRLAQWIAPEWGGAWNQQGLFREHPVGILLPSAARDSRRRFLPTRPPTPSTCSIRRR